MASNSDAADKQATAANMMEVRGKLTAILEAVHSGNLEAFRKATESSNMETQDLAQFKDAKGRTLLHHAAGHGHLKLCRHVVNVIKADINARDESGETSLALAAGNKHVDVVEYLLEQHADVSAAAGAEGSAAIHRAAASGSTTTVQLLLKAGAAVGTPGSNGPPICYAAGEGHAGVVRCLLQHGADPNACTPDDVSALLMATVACSLETVEALLAGGADVSRSCAGGATALHAAAALPEREVAARLVDRLLAAGAGEGWPLGLLFKSVP